MITDRQLASALRDHYADEPAARHDVVLMNRRVLEQIHARPQRMTAWWPLRRRQSTALAHGHGRMVTATTLPIFGATRFAIAGVIVALLGGLMLVSQFARPIGGPGAAPDPGTFSPTGSLAQPRSGHTATLLLDGRVLVVGGDQKLIRDSEVGTATAEVWDPATGTFSPTGSLVEARAYHSATRLPDGRVLVVGGHRGDHDVLGSAEVWDPATGTFSPAGSLAKGRAFHGATLLPGGRVLISDDDPSGTPEIWDPATSTFSPAESLRGDLQATALADGRVLLIVYGANHDETGPTAQVWEPVADTYSPAGSLAMWYVEHATLLPDGRVLAVGPVLGSDPGSFPPASTAIWDPATGMFGPSGSLITEYYYSTATALPDGRVLLVGGCHGHSCHLGYVDSANVWDPVTATFSATGSPMESRVGHTATPLSDGRVLVVGGGHFETPSLASAEIWTPSDG